MLLLNKCASILALLLSLAGMGIFAIKLPEEGSAGHGFQARAGSCGGGEILLVSLGPATVCMNAWVFFTGVGVFTAYNAMQSFAPQIWATVVKKQDDSSDDIQHVEQRAWGYNEQGPNWESLGIKPTESEDGSYEYVYFRDDQMYGTESFDNQAVQENGLGINPNLKEYREKYDSDGRIRSVVGTVQNPEGNSVGANPKCDGYDFTYSYGA